MEEDELRWNYRIIQTEGGFSIHTCFYEDENSEPDSIPDSWTGTAAEPYGETPDELIRDLLKFNKATKMPILVEVDNDLMELIQDGK